MESSGSSLSFLERHAVGHKVEKYYDLELGFMKVTAKMDLIATSWDAEASDRMLVDVSNKAARYGLPWIVWCAITCSLAGCNLLGMAIFVPLSVVSYARPVQMFSLRKYCLVKPSHSVTTHRSLLLNPSERLERSKIREADLSTS